jgi:pentatricopeptide repeat protein
LKENRTPNLEVLNALLFSCSQRPDFFPEIFDILGQMEALEIQPNTETFEHLITACGNTGNYELAVKFFTVMKYL